jgi:hypothetical protein
MNAGAVRTNKAFLTSEFFKYRHDMVVDLTPDRLKPGALVNGGYV